MISNKTTPRKPFRHGNDHRQKSSEIVKSRQNGEKHVHLQKLGISLRAGPPQRAHRARTGSAGSLHRPRCTRALFDQYIPWSGQKQGFCSFFGCPGPFGRSAPRLDGPPPAQLANEKRTNRQGQSSMIQQIKSAPPSDSDHLSAWRPPLLLTRLGRSTSLARMAACGSRTVIQLRCSVRRIRAGNDG